MDLTEKQIRDTLSKLPISGSKIFKLLPEYLQTPSEDPGQVLKAFCGAVSEEFDRVKSQINDIIFLVDPLGVSNIPVYEGSPSFDQLDQFLVFENSPLTTDRSLITISPTNPVVVPDDYYVGFAVRIIFDANGVVNNQYRKVIASSTVNGTTTLNVSPPFSAVPSTGVLSVCYPDRVRIKPPIVASPLNPFGTVLPAQSQGPELRKVTVQLPGISYISNTPGQYVGYEIEILSGAAKGQIRTITQYSVGPNLNIATVNRPWSILPQQGDWFRLSVEGMASTTQDFYKDRYVKITSGSTDTTNGYDFRTETKRIVKSVYNPFDTPASVTLFIEDSITGEGSRFEYPPDSTSTLSIINQDISLLYLARQLGYELDALDSEELQREQIRQAVNFYKLKGTKRGFELVTRSFGLESQIQEQVSNYVRAPDPVEVGPDSCSPPHIQTPWPPNPFIKDGTGQDNVPPEYFVEDRDTTRIGDSDIKIFVRRINPNIEIGTNLFERLLKKLEDVRPAHVEIILIGLFEEFIESPKIADILSFDGTQSFSDSVDISEVVSTLFDSITNSYEDTADVTLRTKIYTEARWDVMDDSYDELPYIPRFDEGTVFNND
jgi:hypothetical protein